jgi:sigma-B regulation protein RsbU (phosphoserine phosphatase)
MSGLPAVFHYQQALDAFRRGAAGDASAAVKRMSELISLLDFTTTLSTGLSNEEILDAALLVVMGELQVARGCLFVREEGGHFRLRASRGVPAARPTESVMEFRPDDTVVARSSGRSPEVFAAYGLEALVPVFKAGRAIAALGLGPRPEGRPFGPDESAFLCSAAACAATPIENGFIYRELKHLNQRLSLKVFQLRNLFDLSRELTGTFDAEHIQKLTATTLLGHLMVSRLVLYLPVPGGLALTHERGARGEEAPRFVRDEEAQPVLAEMRSPRPVTELPEGPWREGLLRARMALLVPLRAGEKVIGVTAVGERVSGAPFGEEDYDFAMTLARQAATALESVRLHQVQLDKLRQDRELQIAREIQQSLFPRECPALDGFAVAAASIPCQAVGGDLYDYVPLADGRLALAVADVSGKGTPASILMASMHASLRALAGTAPPAVLMEQLNRFLFASTQESKYVTLFYAELDPVRRRLVYVNGGHVPPYHLRPGGAVDRLTVGGPVLGLLEDARFEAGEVALAPGELLAMVTDGATEALSADEVEFGDDRVGAVLRDAAGATAPDALARLLEAVQSWVGALGCSDDLTALVLQAL